MRHPPPPETLMRFPDYGLSYKYGGWHLTRTVAVAQANGATRIFVSAGSSCNYCQEREVLRASVVSMDPDGKHPSLVAQGHAQCRRSACGRRVDGRRALRHQHGRRSSRRPAAGRHILSRSTSAQRSALNYGWPTCYFANGKPVHDTTPLPSSTIQRDRAAFPRATS